MLYLNRKNNNNPVTLSIQAKKNKKQDTNPMMRNGIDQNRAFGYHPPVPSSET